MHCETLDFKGLGLKQKDRLNYLSNLESDATKTTEFLSNRLFEQTKQSNKGSSPAEPLILNDIKDLGGGGGFQ